jgi:hypothetical protein
LIKHIFFEPSCHCNLKVSVSELYLNSLWNFVQKGT